MNRSISRVVSVGVTSFLALNPVFAAEELQVSSADASLHIHVKQEVQKLKEKGERKKDEIVVKFKGENKHQNIKVKEGENVDEAIQKFKQRGDVEYAEPNYIVHALMVPNDPYFSPFQWNMDNPVNGGIRMKNAWDVTNGTGVTVAVIDTGVAYETYYDGVKSYTQAPDLVGTMFVPGYDFINNDTHPNDDNSHGTHVTGTIAQSTNNSMGVAGIAFGVNIMPVKVLDSNGSGSYAQVADGIRWAADHSAKVINMSLGGSVPATYLEDAVRYAHDKGVTIVAAAGNDGLGSLSYPAAYSQYVVSVGATRFDRTLASYSNHSVGMDVVAPGGDTSVDQNADGYADGVLQNTFNPNTKNVSSFGYWFFQGTSMASPHVTGVAALIIARGATTSPEGVRKVLRQTATDLGTSGADSTYGYGLVNADAAVHWAPSATPTPTATPIPTITPTPTPTPAPVQVFADSFEVSEWNGSWTESSANRWSRTTARKTDGIFSAEVRGSANGATLTSNPINLQGRTNATITFFWYQTSSLGKNDFLVFDVSTDGGFTWVEKARLRGNVDPEGMWRNVTVNLSGLQNLRIRFRGTMANANRFADVDNVNIMAQ